MKIGQFIYSARKRKGISQEELASLLEVSRQSISLWETDQTVPTLDKLQSMSKILDVSMDELTTGIQPAKQSSVGQVRKLTPEERKENREKVLNKFELISFIISLSTILLWFLGGLGLFVSIIALGLNIINLKYKRTNLTPYGLVICIVFLIASIFRVAIL